MVVFGEAHVYSLHCHLHYALVQVHRAVFGEDVDCSRSQEHHWVLELSDDILGYQVRQHLLHLSALGDGRPQLANQVHGQFLLHHVAAFQLALQVAHVLEEENSRLVIVGFFLGFAAELGEAHPHVSCHSFEVGEVDRGFVLAAQELNWLLVGQLFVFGLQSQVAQKHIILECFCELAKGIGPFLDEHL